MCFILLLVLVGGCGLYYVGGCERLCDVGTLCGGGKEFFVFMCVGLVGGLIADILRGGVWLYYEWFMGFGDGSEFGGGL